MKLPPADRFVLDQLGKDLDHAKSQLKAAAKALKDFASAGPIEEKKARELILSIPGVGEVTAEVVLSEIGDPHRFSSPKKAVAYSGPIPGIRESAGKKKELGITKTGSRLLRWVLVEAAWQAIRYSLKFEAFYEKLEKRCGVKKAIVAVARRLLVVIPSLWRNGQKYEFAPQEKPQTKLPSKAKATSVASEAESKLPSAPRVESADKPIRAESNFPVARPEESASKAKPKRQPATSR